MQAALAGRYVLVATGVLVDPRKHLKPSNVGFRYEVQLICNLQQQLFLRLILVCFCSQSFSKEFGV